MRRLETGSLVAALGGLLLLISLFLDWFGPGVSAWDAFEVWDLLLAALGIAVVVIAAGELGWWGGPVPGVEAVALGAGALVAVAVALLNHPPAALGSSVSGGAWLGLGGAVLMLAGGVMARLGLAVSFGVEPGSSGPPPPGTGGSRVPVETPAPGRGRSGIPGGAPPPVPAAGAGSAGIPGRAPPPVPGAGRPPVGPGGGFGRPDPPRAPGRTPAPGVPGKAGAAGAAGAAGGSPGFGREAVAPEAPPPARGGRRWPGRRRPAQTPEDETDVTQRLPGGTEGDPGLPGDGGLGPPARR